MTSYIVEQLKNARFVLVGKPTPGNAKSGKTPIEKNWNQLGGANYSFNDSKVQQHLKNGGNLGVLCGVTGFAVVDCDSDELVALAEKLPATLTISTSKGKHYYFDCPDFGITTVLERDKVHHGEIQAMDKNGGGKQVICPPSVHYTGKKYEVTRDLPIAKISREELVAALIDYMPRPWVQQEVFERTDSEKISEIELPLDKICNFALLKKIGQEFQGPHPFHGSTTGVNFAINQSKKVWHCFRHNTGGGSYLLLAVREGIIDCSEARANLLRGKLFIKTQGRAVDLGLIPKPEARRPVKNPYDLKIDSDGFLIGKFMVSSGPATSVELLFSADGIFQFRTRYQKIGDICETMLLSNYRMRIRSTNRLGRDFGTGIAQFVDCELVAKNGSVVPFNDQIASLPAFINQQGRGIPRGGLEKLGLAITSLADENIIPSHEGAPAFGLFPGEDGKIIFADGVSVPILAQYAAARETSRKISESLATPKGSIAEFAEGLCIWDDIYSELFPELIPMVVGWNACAPLAYILRREVGLFPHIGFEGGHNLGKSSKMFAFATAYGNDEESSGEALRSAFRLSAILGVGVPTVINEGEGLGAKDFPIEILKNAATQTVATSRGTSDLGLIPMLSCGSLGFTSNVGLISSHGDAGGALSDRMPALLYPEGRLREAFRANNWAKKNQFDESIKKIKGATIFGAEYLRWLSSKTIPEIVSQVVTTEKVLLKSSVLLGRKPKVYAEIFLGLQLLRQFLQERGVPIANFLNTTIDSFQKLAESIEGSDRIPTSEGYSVACLIAEVISLHDSGIIRINEEERLNDTARAIEIGRDGIFYNGQENVLVTTKGLEWLNRENKKRYQVGAAASLVDLRDKLANAWVAEGLLPPANPTTHRYGKTTYKSVELKTVEVLKVANRTGNQKTLEMAPNAENQVTSYLKVTEKVTESVEVKNENVTLLPKNEGREQNIQEKTQGGGVADTNAPRASGFSSLPPKSGNMVTFRDFSSTENVTKSVTSPVTMLPNSLPQGGVSTASVAGHPWDASPASSLPSGGFHG